MGRFPVHFVMTTAPRKRCWLGGAASVMALASSGALADPLDVTSALTAPVNTVAANNNSSGDITVESSGSVIVSTTGPAATINSSNALSNSGTISSSAATGATALLIDGTNPITTTLTNNGAISVTGTGGSGNYGLRLMNGPVAGSIVSGSAGSISVTGDNSYGVSIESAFTGNIGLNGVSVSGANSTAISLGAPVNGAVNLAKTTTATGLGDIGVFVEGNVSGQFVNGGALSTGSAQTTTTDSSGNAVTGAGVGGPATLWVAANLGGGLLNDRYYIDSTGAVVPTAQATSDDTLVTGAIAGYGGTPAILVKPGGANPQDVHLSAYGAAGTDDGYALVNRGAISSAGNNSGTAATAISIGGATIGGTAYTVTLDNGLVNQSTGTIGATTIDATATGIGIGGGATVPTILNEGQITTSASNVITGGAAYGVVVEAGGTVNAVTNSGTISATAAGTGMAAYGIVDRSGTVGSITNSGTITAAADTGSVTRAIDLSAGSNAQTVTNSGTVTGDILFGSGNASYVSNSGTLTGTLAYGAGANQLVLNGTTAFYNPVTLAGGSLAVTLADSSSLQFNGTAPTLSSLAASGQSVLTLDVTNGGPALNVTGAASFTGQSQIRFNVVQGIGSQQIAVMTAAGGITTDHLATLIGATSAPFLYTLEGYDLTPTQILITLHQKSGAEIGFVPGLAPLFDQSMIALANGGAAFDAISSLPDQASMLAAYRQIEPPNYGSGAARVAQSLQSAGSGIVAARIDTLEMARPGAATIPGEESRFGVWTQEFGQFLRHSDSQDDPGFTSNGFGIAFGGDYRLTDHLIAGIGLTFAWNSLTPYGVTAPNTPPLNIDSQMISAYAGWQGGPFFVQAIGTAGNNSYNFHRQITIGSFSASQTADWSGNQIGGDLIVGARFHAGRFIIQPSNAFSYIHMHQDSYAESGGGDFDLAVNAQNIRMATDTTRLNLGYDIPYLGGAIMLGVRGAYVAQLDRDLPPLNASFLAGGSSFDLTTQPLGRSQFQEGATVGFHMPGFAVALNGDRRQESGFSDTSVSAMLRVNF